MINTLATYNLLLVFTAILSTFSGFPMYSCNDHVKIEYKIYCSNNLSNALELICGGKFYSFSKKYPEAIGGSSSPRFYQQSMLLRKLIPQETNKSQGSTGSTHECCKRPCGYAELRLYCAGN